MHRCPFSLRTGGKHLESVHISPPMRARDSNPSQLCTPDTVVEEKFYSSHNPLTSLAGSFGAGGGRGQEVDTERLLLRRLADLFGAPAHPTHYGHSHLLRPSPRLDTRPLAPSPHLTQASRRRRRQLRSRFSRPRACSSGAAWRCGMRPNPRPTRPRSSDRSACPPAALRRG